MSKKYVGFIEPKLSEQEEQGAYFLGASPVPQKPILQYDADWEDALPPPEIQNLWGYETFNCTGFNITTQIEAYEKIAFGESNNYSDRWVGIIAGTDPIKGGNDPQTVYEAIREYGLIPESMLPFTNDIKTVQEYYSFKGGDKEACYKAGQEWKKIKKFMHEWVFKPNDSPELKLLGMKQTYNYSPLALSVEAWNKDNNGIYVAFGNPNHWTGGYGLKDKLTKVYDSYDPFKKLIDQNIKWCKRIHIDKLTPEEVKKNNGIIRSFIKFLRAFLNPKEAEIATKALEENIIPMEEIKPVETKIKGDTIIDTSKDLPKEIIDYIHWAESRTKLFPEGGDTSVIGDVKLKNKAWGCCQIRKPYLDDVNAFCKTTHKVQDCRNNHELSHWAVNQYMRRWLTPARLGRPVTVADILRSHNGGGVTGYKSPRTNAYYQSVKDKFGL